MKIRTVIAVAAAACAGFLTETTHAQNSNNYNLFAQYTTQGASNLTNAGMYPAPHWVPQEMGHTYYTYQPLMPHEMMYTHSRNYYNFNGGADEFYSPKYGHHGGGASLNKTTVVWQNGANHLGPLPGNMYPFAGLHYKIAAHKYGLRPARAGGLCHRSGCDGAECATGDCGAGYGTEFYGGEVYGGDIYSSGCASGSCSAQVPDRKLGR
jgi:hypothetical protein